MTQDHCSCIDQLWGQLGLSLLSNPWKHLSPSSLLLASHGADWLQPWQSWVGGTSLGRDYDSMEMDAMDFQVQILLSACTRIGIHKGFSFHLAAVVDCWKKNSLRQCLHQNYGKLKNISKDWASLRHYFEVWKWINYSLVSEGKNWLA